MYTLLKHSILAVLPLQCARVLSVGSPRKGNCSICQHAEDKQSDQDFSEVTQAARKQEGHMASAPSCIYISTTCISL